MLSIAEYQRLHAAGEIDNQDFFSAIADAGHQPDLIRILPYKRTLFPFYARHGLQHARLIWEGDIADTPQLPSAYCLKPSLGDAAVGVFLMRDGIDLATGKRYETWSEIQTAFLAAVRRRDFPTTCWAEELLTLDGAPPPDVKANAFRGRIVSYNWLYRFGGKSSAFYDADWNLIGKVGRTQSLTPADRQQITAAAEKLLRALPAAYHYVRIDLLLTNNGVYHGELNRTSSNGRITWDLSFPGGEIVAKWLGHCWQETF